MVMTLLALLLSGASFFFFMKEGVLLLRFRKALFLLGSMANVVSTVILIIFLAKAYKAAHGAAAPVDLDRIYPVFWMLGLGGLAAVLAFFGRRLCRLLLAAAGLLTASAWYLAVLAVRM